VSSSRFKIASYCAVFFHWSVGVTRDTLTHFSLWDVDAPVLIYCVMYIGNRPVVYNLFLGVSTTDVSVGKFGAVHQLTPSPPAPEPEKWDVRPVTDQQPVVCQSGTFNVHMLAAVGRPKSRSRFSPTPADSVLSRRQPTHTG